MSDGIGIEVEGLHKRLGRQEVLRGVDLEVKPGETMVVIGNSGGGKSVLLKHLMGLMRPDRGAVRIDGQDIASLNEREMAPYRKKVGILFQNGALFDSMTVGRNVAFPLIEAGERDKSVLKEKVAAALEVVSLKGQESKMPVNLSGGMRKRVALARAIITNPSCILYDEPTAGLDPIVSDSINQLIRHLQSSLGVTSIVVTHDMKSVFHIADRVAYLREGRIYFLGTSEQLRSSEDENIQDFVEGRSRINVELDLNHHE